MSLGNTAGVSLVDSLNINNHVLGLATTSNPGDSTVSYSTINISDNANTVSNNLNAMAALDESKTNLIINYLPQAMTQEDLRNLFSSIGELESCKLIRDKLTGQSLGYGFVNYVKACDAEKAIQSLNGLRMQQKTIKVSFARPSTPLIKDANLYVSGLPKSMNQDDLQRIFEPFGRIITSRILVDPSTGMSRGVGFVRFDKRPEAENAITSLNGTVPSGAKDAITVKFANNPSQKNQQVLQTLYAAASPRQLATPTAGAIYHQPRSFRPTMNELLSNGNMGIGIKRVSPYPEMRTASIMTASGIPAASPALHISPGSADYALASLVPPTALAAVDPLCAIQGMQAIPAIQMQSANAAAAGTAVALPRPLPLPYTQLMQAPEMSATLGNMSSLTPIQQTVPPVTALSMATAGTSSISFLGALPSSNLTSSEVVDATSASDSVVQLASATTTTTTATPTSWYSSLNPELLSTVGMPSGATSSTSSSVISQSTAGICIFVYNLAPDTDESMLWQLFGPFGAVTSVKIIRDFQTQKCKGYGFVTMTNYEEAFVAVCSLNNYKLGDRVLQVSFKTAKQAKLML